MKDPRNNTPRMEEPPTPSRPSVYQIGLLLQRLNTLEQERSTKAAKKALKKRHKVEEAERRRAAQEDLVQKVKAELASQWEEERTKYQEALAMAYQRIEELEVIPQSEESPEPEEKLTRRPRVSFNLSTPSTPTQPRQENWTGPKKEAVTPLTLPREYPVRKLVPTFRSDRTRNGRL